MMSLGPTLVRALTALLAAVATVGQVTYLDALSWHVLDLTPPTLGAQMSGAFLTLLTAHAVVSVAAAVLGVWLTLHEGERQAASRALGLALAAWAYLLAYSGITLFARPSTPGLSRSIFEGHFLLVELIGLVGLLRFTSIFPQNLLEQRVEPSPTLPGALLPAHRVSVWMLRPASPWIVAILVAGGLWLLTALQGAPAGNAALHPLMDVFRVFAAGLVVVNLRRAWSRADGEGITRLTWLLVALASLVGILLLYIGGNVLVGVTDWPEPDVAWRPLLVDIGVLGFLVALATSVLSRGRVDPRRLGKRILASSAVATFGLFLAAALEALFSGGILAAFSLRTGVGTVLAFAAIVATHRALMRYLERLLDQIPIPEAG